MGSRSFSPIAALVASRVGVWFRRRRTTQSRVAVSHPLTPSHSGREDTLVAVVVERLGSASQSPTLALPSGRGELRCLAISKIGNIERFAVSFYVLD